MNLVEAEDTGPNEGDEPLVTPPRPLHRRVSVSLLFTLTVLTSTVVAIFLSFPARNQVLMGEAIERHREASASWDLTTPTAAELRAWAIGVIGKSPPLPNGGKVVGARETQILDRRAALVRLELEGEPITYVVQQTPVVSPDHNEVNEGDLRAVAWREGEFTCVAVGASASAARWQAAIPTR